MAPVPLPVLLAVWTVAVVAAAASPALRLTDIDTGRAAPVAFPTTVAAVGNDSVAAAHHLAASLAGHLQMRVVPPAAARGLPHVAVGFGAATAAGVPAAQLVSLGDDGYTVTSCCSVAAGSVAVGASPGSLRGAMNGVFALLRQLGFQTLAPNVTQVPASVPAVPSGAGGWDLRVLPPFEEREVMADGVANCCCTCPATNTSGALGFNGIHAHGPAGIRSHNEWQAKYAVGAQVARSTDNVFFLLDPDPMHPCLRPKGQAGPVTYLCPSVFDAHPDWFVCRNTSNKTAAEPLGATVYPCTKSLVNVPYAMHVCWSHPTLVQKLVQAVLGVLNQSRSVLRPIATIAQMDGNELACPLDHALNVAENSTGGAQFHAINRIAAAVAADFPNATVSTLAYHGSREPPKKLRLLPNVMVRVCLDTVDQSAPLSHRRNADWAARLRAWTAAAPKIWV
eukprot:SAG22_NODE_407_length_10957_cov_5.081691_3_plen_451_part_00